jgi:methionyl-tRNA formyltransferase
MRIVFFGTSDVGLPILDGLVGAHEVVQVVTSPDAPVGRKQELQATPIATLAASLNLPVVKPESVKNNPEFLEFLRNLNADIFIVVSYGKILPAELLDIPRLKTLNVHFSMLPKYRGAAPIQYALLNGETTTGTTIFILDELVDHGPILVQQEFPIAPDDTFPALAKKLANLSASLLVELLPKYEAGEISPQEQNHDQATFTKLIKKEHGKIDWTKPAQEIYNMWRAFTPWPGIWTTWHNETFKILQAEVVDETAHQELPQAVVKCGENTFLHLIEVQPAGKSPMTMKDFLNGQKDFKPEDFI